MGHPARLERVPPEGTLVLVRHGESTWSAEGRFQGRADPPLSPLGQLQARLVAARLADREKRLALQIPVGPPIAVWHSPLRRTRDTARVVAGSLADGDSLLRAVPGLVEIDQGEWQGRLGPDVAAEYPDLLAAWRATPTLAHAPGGESLATAGQRVRRAARALLDTIDRADPPRTRGCDGSAAAPAWGIVVAHDGILRLLLMTLLELPFERFWSLPFALCAISLVELRPGSAALRAHNLAEHLDATLEASLDATLEASLTAGDRGGGL